MSSKPQKCPFLFAISTKHDFLYDSIWGLGLICTLRPRRAPTAASWPFWLLSHLLYMSNVWDKKSSTNINGWKVRSSATTFLIDKSGVHDKTWKNWTKTWNWLDDIGPWFKFRAGPMFEVAFEVRFGWIREPYTSARGMWGARSGQGRFSCKSQKFWVLRGPLSLEFCQIFHYCPKRSLSLISLKFHGALIEECGCNIFILSYIYVRIYMTYMCFLSMIFWNWNSRRKLTSMKHWPWVQGGGRGSLGKPRARSRRQRLFTYFHFFSFSLADLSLIIIHYGLNWLRSKSNSFHVLALAYKVMSCAFFIQVVHRIFPSPKNIAMYKKKCKADCE